MKKIILILTVLLFGFVLHAQDKIYVHTATAANTSGHITYIDHPDLNGNPNAAIVYKHVWNPNTSSGVYNDNIDGLWYNSSAGKWAIYNEDHSTPMVLGASFFVYIASNPNDVITHVADAAHIGSSNHYTQIDDSDFNNHNPGPYAVMSNYYNPNGVYNPHNYGFFYDSTDQRRNIYSEDNSIIPTNAGFKILKYGGTGVITRFTAESTTANISAAVFFIDNPHLNANPNAAFVFQHYYGINGTSSQVEIDKVLSAYYSYPQGKWAIYTEDQSSMPVGIAVDIIVVDRDVLGVEEITNQINFSVFPNPAIDAVKITANQAITNIDIYSLLGQKVASFNSKDNLSEISVKNLNSGVYLLKAKDTNGNLSTTKLIKK